LVRRSFPERRTFFSAPETPVDRGSGTFFSLRRSEAALLLLFLLLLTYPLLYLFRSFDDNTLTSWRWMFAGTGPAVLFLLVVPVLLAALVLSRIEPGERREGPVLFLAGLAAALPLWSLPEPIIDASRYFMQAKYAAQEGLHAFLRDWGGTLDVWTDLPAVPLLFGALFRMFGEHRIVMQSFTTLLFASSVVLTAAIGRRLWDRETGFLAGTLLLAMPYLLVQVPLMLVDVPTLFLVTLSIHAYLVALERRRPLDLACAAAAVSIALLAKYSTWPMLLILPVITLLQMGEGRSGTLRSSVTVLAAAAAGAGIFLLWHLEAVRHQLAVLRSYQWPALGRWGESTASSFLFQVHPFVTLAAAIGAVRAVRHRDLRFLVPGWFVLFAVALQVERIRYLLPLFPLLALMAAYGLRWTFADASSRRFAAYGAAAATLVLVLAVYQPFLDRTTMANLRDAGAYLDTLPGTTVVVRVDPQSSSSGNTEAAIPVLDLFTGKRIVYERHPVDRPDRRSIEASPLRFTWEQRLPDLYEDPATGRVPVALISGKAQHGEEPVDRQRSKVFRADTGTFRYRTAVEIWHEGPLSANAHPPASAVPFGTAR
jgi:hypothetical protein